ncbi:MAG: hypothetical protein LC737_08215, partial [Chloroflexi bacterium]|nr:hypothetical protein [Chloroflexota bacterium]
FSSTPFEFDVVHINSEYPEATRESDHDVPLVRLTLSSPTAVRLDSFGAHVARADNAWDSMATWGAVGVLLAGMTAALTVWRVRRRVIRR